MTKTSWSTALILIAAVLLSLAAVNEIGAGEKLYNGIILPDQWPPKIEKLTLQPRPVPYLQNPPQVIPIDIGRQLFVDDFLIEETNLQRTFYTAQYYPRNPILKADRPWENTGRGPTTIVFSDGVWYDPADKIFKMWYMAPYLESTCYATSRDGINWEKPSLDVVEGTNIVLKSVHRDSAIVWLDLYEKDPQRRYKMTMYHKQPKRGVAIRFSPDGIHWSDIAAWTGPTGDRTTCFYNPFRKVWVHSLRGFVPVGPSNSGVRMRHYWEGPDLISSAKWKSGEPVLWVGADHFEPRRPGYDLQRQLYNLDAVAYESLIIGLFSIWQGPSNTVCNAQGIQKRNEILLGFSRDGFHWYRPDRRPFIGVDETPGSWNHGNVQSAGGGFLIIGDRLCFYFSGRSNCRQGHWDSCASTGIATIRRDGFASMDAGYSKGTLTTRPLRFKGKYLFVNAAVDNGELRVEVLDQKGHIINPFTHDNCIPLRRNATFQMVKWQDTDDLDGLAGQPVRFRFYLTKGQLYSFWVSPDLSGASHGYVAAGGPGFSGPTDTVGPAVHAAASQK
ncbi:MAG: hypothetical protein JSV03_02255 [Planctomycetota bacterium]|nr:MAG: hypothetical protein JSV03_02255 [Planctomycetota bacterium]